VDQTKSDKAKAPRPEPRPYFGKQEPDFGEGGGFGKHEDEPRYGTFGGRPGGRGPLESNPSTSEGGVSNEPRPSERNFAQQNEGGKYEGGESTGGYADHRSKVE